jgi:hypothetical protein
MRLLYSLLFILLAVQALSAQPDENIHVVVFGVDGMSPDGVRHAHTPHMHQMMEHGAYTLHARSVLPTSSSPNWASMISGAGPDRTGVTSNSWERNDDGIAPVVIGDEGIFPTIFSVVRHGKPTAEIGVIHDWDGLARLVEATKGHYIKHEDGPYNTITGAVKYIETKKPDFLFLHLDNVDGAGHEYGHGSAEYYKAVGLADSLLGVVEQAYRQAGIYDHTVFIVAADHGGIGHGHGGESMAEMEIPLILSGPGVKHGYEIRGPVYQYDNAATIAYIWRLPTPGAWIGRPVRSAFEGHGDEVADVLERFTLEAPQIITHAPPAAPAGELFIDSIPTVVIKTDPAYKLYYTTDGSEPTDKSQPYTAPFKVYKTTVVKVKSFDTSGSESPTVCGFYRVRKKSGLHPMIYGYYESAEDLEVLPDFKSMEPVKTGHCNEFNLAEIPNRGSNFALVLGGYIYIGREGDYKFYTSSDDGSKLYIDDKLCVNNDGSHGVVWHSGDKALTKGWHTIKATYFNGGGGQVLNVYYKGPGITKQLIPADVLYGQKP